MPLPWIKAKKVTRILPNRSNSSLVVQTGFPTSLLDLYVKNQDRFRKSKPPPPHKKKIKSSQESHISDTPIICSPPMLSTDDNLDAFWGPTVSKIEKQACPDEEMKGRMVDECGLEVRRDKGVVFKVFMKVFVVVVLALGMKKFAVGITMSAFVLLFLEYMGGFVLKPCKPILDYCCCCCCSLQKRVNLMIGIKESVSNVGVESFEDCIGARDSYHCEVIEEIEVVESNSTSSFDSVCEIEDKRDCLMVNFDDGSREKRWGVEGKRVGEEDGDGVGHEVVEHKNDRGSRGARFKSKIIKKFVPKKLRNKKGKKCKENEVAMKSGDSSYVGGGDNGIGGMDGEQEEERSGEGLGIVGEGFTSLQSLLELEGGEDDKFCSFDELIKAGNANALVGKKNETETMRKAVELIKSEIGRNALVGQKIETETKAKSGYLMLVLIVLVGLLSGRVIAFLLAIVWCLILKSVKTLKREKNVSMTV